MADENILLDIRGLTKCYKGDAKALDDVSLNVRRGEFVTIIGASGAGKSTLLRCINRLIEPTSGSVVFDGREMTQLGKRDLRLARQRISMIFQHYNLVYRMTAIENVLHGRLGYKSTLAGALGLYSEDEKALAFKVLDQVGLADFAYKRTDQLSGGQKQRVGIARALVQEPLLMLCESRPQQLAHSHGAFALGGRRAGHSVPGQPASGGFRAGVLRPHCGPGEGPQGVRGHA